MKKLVLCLVASATALLMTDVVWAGGSTAPQADLDPDRGMTFGRYPKIRIDSAVSTPMKQSSRYRAIDPAIDPYDSIVGSDRYDPQSGKIHGSLSDTLREMRRRQEMQRGSRDSRRRQAERRRSGDDD
jgi:hypothetical protein